MMALVLAIYLLVLLFIMRHIESDLGLKGRMFDWHWKQLKVSDLI